MVQSKHTFLWVSAFAVSMAFIESAVVVYLRAIYYPEGFTFPLKIINDPIGTTEIIREAATLIMLVSIGFIAGRKPIERFAYFLYSFAVWDIFYYIFLKLILNWPESIFTWDILFLIPLVWVGPVLAPIINSLTMIALAVAILICFSKNKKAVIGVQEWMLLIIGSVITMINYMEDYTSFMLQRFTLIELFSSANTREIINLSSEYIPFGFNWYWFSVGQLMFIGAVILFIRRNRSHS